MLGFLGLGEIERDFSGFKLGSLLEVVGVLVIVEMLVVVGFFLACGLDLVPIVPACSLPFGVVS
jgi:hypothetical protein